MRFCGLASGRALGRLGEWALKGMACGEGVGHTHLHPGPDASLRVSVGRVLCVSPLHLFHRDSDSFGLREAQHRLMVVMMVTVAGWL